MTVLRIEHKVGSYDGWKKAFDNDPIGRKKSGVKHYKIFRPADDPNYVIIDLYFDSMDDAKATLRTLGNLWTKVEGTVMVSPKARIMSVEEAIDL